MKQKLLGAALALLLSGMATLLGIGAYRTHAEIGRHGDFADWRQTSGSLVSLEIRQTLYRYHWRHMAVAEYRYAVDERRFSGNVIDLNRPVHDTADEAKAFAEAALGIKPPASWSAVRHDTGEGWTLAVKDMPVVVRYSPHDPTLSTLTGTPPMSKLLSWLVIVVLSLLALAIGLGALAALGAIFFPIE